MITSLLILFVGLLGGMLCFPQTRFFVLLGTSTRALFILLVVVSVFETVLTISWSRWYFETGLPAFSYSVSASVFPNAPFTPRDIEKLLPESRWIPWVVAPLGDRVFAVRERWSNFLKPTYRSTPLMHCVLSVDYVTRVVSARGYLNWSIILLPIVLIALFSVPREAPSLVVAGFSFFLLVLYIASYKIQTSRLKDLCNRMALAGVR